MVLDVDGVLDRQIFGFPSTTASGIHALSLLASHGFAVALNTARSVSQTQEYCRAYGFVGGVAEYGSYVSDAVSGREQVLVSPESCAELEELRRHVGEIPGVFVDERCRFILRCYTYARGTTIPLPESLIAGLIEKLELGRVQLHQTYSDSTVIAREVNKGAGLRALLALAGYPDLKTFAVGDSEPDLPMFRAATRCFAPAQVGCPQPARALGCTIAAEPYQSGLLEIARRVVHPNGGTCPRCRMEPSEPAPGDELFLRMLRTADLGSVRLLARSLADPRAIRVFKT
jgi:hydroxymethylpyrimidine pyrophosphatase-like HAD family hydrolase